MDYHKTCFFCCKHFKYELPHSWNDNTEINQACRSLAIGETSSPIKCKANQQVIFQLSQYLKVPRNLIAQFKDGHSSTVSICEDCEEISETLSKLCKELEVTKMKISHYLNLLTDRIIGINNGDLTEDNEEQVYHPKMPLSDLQKIIHKNCLSKVREHEDKAIPQVRLTKCDNPSPEQPQLNTDHMEENNNPIYLEADEHHFKMNLPVDNHPELHSCPFCNFTANCGDKLHGHITNQHSEQFERNLNSPNNSTYYPSKTVKKIFKKCEICGVITGSRDLARHKRLKHQIYYQKLTTVKNKPQKIATQIKCDFCPLTLRNLWSKAKHTEALHLHQSSQLVGNKKGKKCDICGAMVPSSKIAQHKKLRHKNFIQDPLDITINANNPAKRFKCVVCGYGYEVKRSLWKHYQSSEMCGKGKNAVMMESVKDCGTTEILIMPESQIKKETVAENGLEQVEDPLQI